MASYRGHELPDEIIQALDRGIDEIDEEILLLYAKTHRDRFKGFRLKKNNIPAFRKQLRTRLRRAEDVDDDLLSILAMGGLTLPVVDVLCPEHLARSLPSLLSIFGAAEFLAAMLADARPIVRMLAIEYLEATENLKNQRLPDPEIARDMVRDWMLPLFQHSLTALRGNEVFDLGDLPRDERSMSGPSADTATLEERIRHLEADAKTSERQAHKERRKLSAQIETLQSRNRKLEQECAKERRRAEESGTAAARATREAETLRLQMQERLSSETEKALRERVRRWLADPEDLAVEIGRIHEADGHDTLDEADVMLRRQAESDRHYGNRATLHLRLDRLVTAKTKLDEARRDAMNPLAELRVVAEKVGGEIDRLRSRLNADTPTKPVVEKLMVYINEAETAEALQERYRLLNELADAGALDDADVRRLYGKYNRVMGRLYDAYSPRVVRGPEPRDPTWKLRKALDENDPMLLFLDGHNILFNLSDYFAESWENGVPGARARQHLVAIMGEILSCAPGIQARVYFDGPTYAEHQHGANVYEIYSGGGDSDQRADRAIAGHLEFCCRQYSAMPRIVVTDDRALSSQARELGAEYVRLQQFGALLDEFLMQPQS